MIVGAELEIADALRRIRQQLQEQVEILGRGVVGARCSDHVDPLETQLGLERTQRVHLAGNADQGDPLVPGRSRRFEQRQQRGIAHAHPAHPGHVFCPGDQDRIGPPAIFGMRPDRQHGIHRTGFQQPLAEPRNDSGPLRAG